MNKIRERFDAAELIQDAEDQQLIRRFVDADSTEEQIDTVIALVDAGLGPNEIGAALQSLKGAIS